MTYLAVIQFLKPCFGVVLAIAAGAVFGAEFMKKLPIESAVKAVIQPVGKPVPVVIPKPEPAVSSNHQIQSPVAERLSK